MKKTTVAIAILLTSFFGYTQESIISGKKYIIDSDVLNEDREIWIGLPAYYDSTKSYPTVYVLDAEWQFDITLSLIKELANNDKIPEHIVVGIPKIDSQHRFRDLTFTNTLINSMGIPDSSTASFFSPKNTGHGRLFLNHINKEVFPFVNSTFKTNGFDVFIGHSLSGYFGAYIMSMENSFNAFQLYDPSIWYNNGDVIDHLIKTISSGYNSNVFITSASGGKNKHDFHIAMHDSLNIKFNELSINSKLKVYPHENHGSVRLPSIIDGLSDLYKGFSIGYILPTDSITVLEAENHYKNFSEKVNYNFSCPAGTYRWIGFANHSQGNWNEAIKAYNNCKDTFKNDHKVTREIAECYFEINELELSLSFYERTLVLNPENESLQSIISELKLLIVE
jgi:predicted alpha/beta superfamily hydrolase